MAAAFCCLLAGCSSSEANLPVDHLAPGRISTVGDAAQGQTGQLEQLGAKDQTYWEGTAGLDYDPALITVNFNPFAKLPRELIDSDPGQTSGANRQLCRNNQCIEFAAAIAGRYKWAITREVYLGGCNFAEFALPPDTEGRAALARLLNEFDSVIMSAGLAGLARPAFEPDDPKYVESTSFTGPQWYLKKIGCSAAWDYTTGDPGVLVGVVDTGVDLDHEELVGQVLDPATEWPEYELNLVLGNNNVADDHGHGTAIAGVIAAQTNNTRSIAGVAHDCRIIPVKVANDISGASYGVLAEGCLLAAELGAKVVNLSWVGYGGSAEISTMIDELVSQEKLLVVAAGNDGSMLASVPGKYPGCLSVGATEQLDQATAWSNKGPEVDLAAPGEDMFLAYAEHPTSYRSWWGTSFSSPQVAAGAALLFSLDETLLIADVRNYLETTGPIATGFNAANTTHRLSLPAALAEAQRGLLGVPQLSRLIYWDSFTLTPDVASGVTLVECFDHDTLLASAAAEPFKLRLETADWPVRLLNAEFRAQRDGDIESEHLPLIIDNTSGAQHLIDHFSEPERAYFGLELKTYRLSFLENIKQLPAENWNELEVRLHGSESWELMPAEGVDATACLRIGGLSGYDSFETDVVASARIDLRNATAATLQYDTRYNIENDPTKDLASVLIATVNGSVFEPLMSAGLPVQYYDYQPTFSSESWDLADYLGQEIQVVFLFESDGEGTGSEAGEPAGWWLDNIRVESEYDTALLNLGEPVLNAQLLGAIYGEYTLTASYPAAAYMERIDYWLDLAPFDQLDPYDITGSLPAPRNSLSFEFTAEEQNRVAVLHATAYAGPSELGSTTLPIYLFNHLGDVNADGLVDAADTAAFSGMVGLSSEDAGFIPFFDTDFDGVITEADTAIVGYNYSP